VTATRPPRVVCTSLNPALDITYVGQDFAMGEVNRVGRVHAHAGGKGVNVARLLQQTGHQVMITGFAGGRVGDEIRDHLDEWNLEHRLVRCAASSRRTVSVFSSATGRTTAYYEDGPPVTAAEWLSFADGFREVTKGADAVVLSGSLPAGLPAETYRDLAGTAAAAGAATFVDAHAAPLRASLAAKPTLVKPNEHELAEAAGLPLPVSLAAAGGAARGFLTEGAQSVVVSLGARGLLGVLPGTALLATPPQVPGNPVGAGDAALAALVGGHLAGLPWPDRLRCAAAMSAAAVRQHVAGVVHTDDVAELAALVEVGEPWT
jgi:1-phosphofructokinase family hexose kinase